MLVIEEEKFGGKIKEKWKEIPEQTRNTSERTKGMIIL